MYRAVVSIQLPRECETAAKLITSLKIYADASLPMSFVPSELLQRPRRSLVCVCVSMFRCISRDTFRLLLKHVFCTSI